MKHFTIEQKFFFSESLRILFSFCIFFVFTIPLFYKIILLIISDTFDCGFSKLFFKEWIDPNTEVYQISDKVCDTIGYTFLLIYLWTSMFLCKKYNSILTVMYFYRLIGTLLYIIFQERQYLLYFPNFFLESSLIFTGLKQFSISKKYLPIFFALMIFWKLLQEYYLHIFKKSHPNAIL